MEGFTTEIYTQKSQKWQIPSSNYRTCCMETEYMIIQRKLLPMWLLKQRRYIHIFQVLTSKPVFGNSPAFSIATLKDTASIFSSKDFVLRALSDLRAILAETHLQFKEKLSTPVLKKLDKEVVLAEKKMMFFLSWINETDIMEFVPLQVELEDEFKSQSEMLALRKKNKG